MEVQMKYKIALRKSDEGNSVSAPGVPGYWSQGDTEDEAIANIEMAICEYLDAKEIDLFPICGTLSVNEKGDVHG